MGINERNINLEITIDNRVIKSIIDYTEIKNCDQYCFSILKDGIRIEQTNWTNERTYNYELDESGIYQVYGYIRRNAHNYLKKSFPISFHNQNDIKKYSNFLTENPEGNILNNRLEYKKSEYPNQDFCLVSSKGNKNFNDKLTSFASEYKFNYFEMGKIQNWDNIVLADEVFTNENKKYIFSGVSMVNENYISGYDKALYIYSDQIYGNLGMFSLIEIIKDHGIRVSNDFFNFAPLFYFKNENINIISNRYHLLLLVMKALGFKGELDQDKVIVNITNDSVVMHQSISHDMDIIGCKQLKSSYDFVLNDRDWELVKNEYGNILNYQYGATDKEQNDLIEKICEDIIKQLKTLINDERFQNIIVDLSGGLDSRLIYAALTNINADKDKIKISARDVGGDLPIALQINNIYQYNYDDVPIEKEFIPLKMANMLNRSFFMGQYFSHSFINNKISQQAIRCVGAMGEAIYRKMFTRQLKSNEYSC